MGKGGKFQTFGNFGKRQFFPVQEADGFPKHKVVYPVRSRVAAGLPADSGKMLRRNAEAGRIVIQVAVAAIIAPGKQFDKASQEIDAALRDLFLTVPAGMYVVEVEYMGGQQAAQRAYKAPVKQPKAARPLYSLVPRMAAASRRMSRSIRALSSRNNSIYICPPPWA